MRKPPPTPSTEFQITVRNFGLHESGKIQFVVDETKLRDVYVYMLSICTDTQAQLANFNILNAYELTMHLHTTNIQARRLCLVFMLSSVYSKIGERMYADAMFMSNVRPICMRYLGNIFGTMSFKFLLRYAGALFSKQETDQYLYKQITNTKMYDEVIKFKQCVAEIRTMSLLADPLLHYESYEHFYDRLSDSMEFGNNDNISNALSVFRLLADKRIRANLANLESKWGVYKGFAKRLSITSNRVSQICFSMLLYKLKQSGEVVDLPIETRALSLLEKVTKLLVGYNKNQNNQELLKKLVSTVRYSICLNTLDKMILSIVNSTDEVSVSNINYARDMVRVNSMSDLAAIIKAAFARLEV